MYYQINVSLNGRHFFGTAEHSIQSETQLRDALQIFTKKFTAEEGYAISVYHMTLTGKDVDISKYLCGCGNMVKGEQRTQRGSHHGTECSLYDAPSSGERLQDARRSNGRDVFTNNEFKVMRAIDMSEYSERLSSAVWSFTIADNSNLKGKTISGACSSLSNKGLIRCEGSGKQATIIMTKAGISAFLTACTLRNVKPSKEA